MDRTACQHTHKKSANILMLNRYHVKHVHHFCKVNISSNSSNNLWALSVWTKVMAFLPHYHSNAAHMAKNKEQFFIFQRYIYIIWQQQTSGQTWCFFFVCTCKTSHLLPSVASWCSHFTSPHWYSIWRGLFFCHRSDWFLYCIWHLHGQDGREGQTHDWILQHPQWDCDETCHHDHVVSITRESHWLIMATHLVLLRPK